MHVFHQWIPWSYPESSGSQVMISAESLCSLLPGHLEHSVGSKLSRGARRYYLEQAVFHLFITTQGLDEESQEHQG